MGNLGKMGHRVQAMVSVLLMMLCFPGPVWGVCQNPMGDVNGDASVDVSDVQCTILVALATLQAEDLSTLSCLSGPAAQADIDCSGSTSISDVLFVMGSAFQMPLSSQLDADLSGCPDTCEQGPFCMDCETDWSLISDSLLDKMELLPSPPETPLDVEWPEHLPQVRWDTLSASDVPQDWMPTDGCSSGLWDSERITAGTPYVNDDGEERCWASVGTGDFNEGKYKEYFYFRNRKGGNSSAIVGDPAWVQARFPMPPGHETYRLDVTVRTPRLFGFPPQMCTDSLTNEDGSCNYATEEDWEESTPGLYVLWSTPGATSYHVTGPYIPSDTPPPWGDLKFSPEIPQSLMDVDELVVTVFLYRQYPRECWMVVDEDTGVESKTCTDGYAGNNMALQSIGLETRAISLAGDGPPVTRPRLFGDNETWLADHAAFDAMPCITIEQSDNVVGDLENIKNLWDQATLGSKPCEGEEVPPLAEHPAIAPYLADIAALKAEDDWKPDPKAALHAIRRTKACLNGPSPESCQATAEELNGIIASFKAEEVAHIDDATWCATACSVGFDLQTGPLVFRWSLFVDILWDDLTAQEHAVIAEKLGEMIDNFLNIGDIRHWALFNGNNWTPALVHGALAWAIAYYHEDPRALDVAILAVGSMWRHDHIWKSDGSYEEGLSYGGHDMSLLGLVTRLYKRSFGTPHFTPWSYLENTGQWYVDMMATDGWTVDFGDSTKSMGWKISAPMMAPLAAEWASETPASLDPCVARAYWSHKYWFHGFYRPWAMHPWMARDWQELMGQCDQVSPEEAIVVYPVGGWAAIRSWQPGSSGVTDDFPAAHKGHDADKTMLAVSAVPNSFAHMEADFGSLIWSAFGSRLLADIGYGSQAKDIYATQKKIGDVVYPMIDNGPMGHTTLSIPEASFVHDYTGLVMNTSHIEDAAGTVVQGTWGEANGLHLDGAYVYGKVDGSPVYAEAEDYGWLEHFDRWLIRLPGGHFLVADSFLKRADREDITAQETWTFYHDPPEEPLAECKYKEVHAHVSVIDATTVQIEPVCSMLFHSMFSTTVGRILAASVTPGAFTQPEVFDNYKNNGGTVTHKRLHYQPESPVAHDARVFALIAAPSPEAFPEASLVPVSCTQPEDACFALTLDGATTVVHFSWDGSRHVLSSVDLP